MPAPKKALFGATNLPQNCLQALLGSHSPPFTRPRSAAKGEGPGTRAIPASPTRSPGAGDHHKKNKKSCSCCIWGGRGHEPTRPPQCSVTLYLSPLKTLPIPPLALSLHHF